MPRCTCDHAQQKTEWCNSAFLVWSHFRTRAASRLCVSCPVESSLRKRIPPEDMHLEGFGLFCKAMPAARQCRSKRSTQPGCKSSRQSRPAPCHRRHDARKTETCCNLSCTSGHNPIARTLYQPYEPEKPLNRPGPTGAGRRVGARGSPRCRRPRVCFRKRTEIDFRFKGVMLILEWSEGHR